MSVLNVKAEPHDASTYRRLLERAYKKKIDVKYYGNRVARIGSLFEIEPAVLGGEFWIFTQIDPQLPVINLESGTSVDPTEMMESGFDWSAHGFDHKSFPFVFFEKDHRLGFEDKLVSVANLRTVVEGMLNRVKANLELDSVTVEVEQEPGQLERIFKLELERLTIHITRPNPDDLDDLEGEFLAELAAQNAAAQEVKLVAEPGTRLTPNERTRNLAEIALSNGYVEGRGRDEATARKETVTTQEAPLRVPAEFNPNDQTLMDVLLQTTSSAIRSIRDRFRRRR